MKKKDSAKPLISYSYITNQIDIVINKLNETEDEQSLKYLYHSLAKLYDVLAKLENDEDAANHIMNDIIPYYTNLEQNCKSLDENEFEKPLDLKPYMSPTITFSCSQTGEQNDNEVFFDFSDSAATETLKDESLWKPLINDIDNEDTLETAQTELDVKDHNMDFHMNIADDKKNLERYEMVQHPSHYNLYSTEAVDMIYKIYGDKCDGQFMPLFCEATALLYRLRMGLKPDNSVQQELKKESWWLDKRDSYKNK